MMHLKKLALVSVLFVATSAIASAQFGAGFGAHHEMTIEESYLQETIELMIIREQSRSNSRDMKFVALEYMRDMIARGNRSDELHSTLEFLGLEGVRNMTREAGRLVNNFPDVRVRTAMLLAQMGTPQARDILQTMLLAENEPMVIAEVIRSLGAIGLNDNEETANAISFVVTRFDIISPDNLLALATLDAFEQIAAANGGIVSVTTINTIIRIAEGNYIRPVRDRARVLLSNLRGVPR